MRPPNVSWPLTRLSENTLFFAQVMRELMAAQSFESFRVHSLETVSRLKEAEDLEINIRRKKISDKAIAPALDELEWSLKRDPVYNKRVPNHLKAVFQENIASKKELHSTLRMIRSFVSVNYKEQLEDIIFDLVKEGKRKFDISSSCNLYCSHLISIGYSRQFILRSINETFFSHKSALRRAPSIRAFYRIFNGNEYKFDVVFKINKNYSKIFEKFMFSNFDASQSKFSTDITASIPLGVNEVYMHHKAKALDADGAAMLANRILGLLRSMSILNDGAAEVVWGSEMFVSRVGGATGRLSKLEEAPLAWRRSVRVGAPQRIARGISENLGRLLRTFEPESQARMYRSITTAASSRLSANGENQLISLWSAVEALLSDPDDGKNRIDHFLNLLTPCICLGYPERKTRAVYTGIMVAHRSRLNSFLESVVVDGITDKLQKFGSVIYRENMENQQKELFKIIGENPLAKHRVFCLAKDFGTPASILDAVSSHEKRVRWQLNRIYRARNFLVHAGSAPDHLHSIVINMNEYFLSTLRLVGLAASKSGTSVELDYVISKISIEYSSMKMFFDMIKKKDSPLSSDGFGYLFLK